MRWRSERLCQRAVGQPADIAVAVQLPPCPAFAVAVVDRDPLALQSLRRQLGIGRWFAAQRRETIDDFEFLTGDEARGPDLAFQIFRSEIGPRRRQARVIHSVGSAICRSRARPGIRRLRDALALPTASSRRYRRAASSWRPRRNAAGTARR